MSQMPPEDVIPDVELDAEEDSLDPERDADGVSEDRLTGYAVYDNVLTRYEPGVYSSKAKASKAKPDGDRYSVRRV